MVGPVEDVIQNFLFLGAQIINLIHEKYDKLFGRLAIGESFVEDISSLVVAFILAG